MKMKLEHEHDMAKIKFNEAKLNLECEKMSLCHEQLRAEAAAHGQDPGTFPSGGVMEKPTQRMHMALMHACMNLMTKCQYRHKFAAASTAIKMFFFLVHVMRLLEPQPAFVGIMSQ